MSSFGKAGLIIGRITVLTSEEGKPLMKSSEMWEQGLFEMGFN